MLVVFRFILLLETVDHEIKPSIFHMIGGRLKQQIENKFFITRKNVVELHYFELVSYESAKSTLNKNNMI